MTKLRKRMMISLVALSLGAGSLAVHAEKGAEPGAARHGHAAHGERMHSPERMKERFEKRQAQLHDKLKLDAKQEAAWKSYVDVIRPGTPPARLDRAELEKLPAPERMQKMLNRMQDREKRMALHIAAMREFYATLTPEQQKVFDAEFAFGTGRHGHRGHHHRHHGGDRTAS